MEGATSARPTAEATAARVLPSGRPHANFVNAAFAYWRPRERNRFNGPSVSAWYAALEVETSIAEVTFHTARELGRAGEPVVEVLSKTDHVVRG